MRIRLYQPHQDEAVLLGLWQVIFSAEWPLTQNRLGQATACDTAQPGDHLLVEIDGQAVGFAITQTCAGDSPRGSLLALGIHPAYRRQGLGRVLHVAAIAHLRQRGARTIQLGAGGLNYFWPGVPLNLPAAWPFFDALGWQEEERSFDMIRSLDGTDPAPPWVWQRTAGLTFTTATAEDAQPVHDLLAADMPGWQTAYARAFQENRSSDVLLARTCTDGEILGVCLAETHNVTWAACFTGRSGAAGCLLTASHARERGIGMALTAFATQQLQARGCHTALLGWTWLVDWYAKLDYRVWQEYIMSTRVQL